MRSFAALCFLLTAGLISAGCNTAPSVTGTYQSDPGGFLDLQALMLDRTIEEQRAQLALANIEEEQRALYEQQLDANVDSARVQMDELRADIQEAGWAVSLHLRDDSTYTYIVPPLKPWGADDLLPPALLDTMRIQGTYSVNGDSVAFTPGDAVDPVVAQAVINFGVPAGQQAFSGVYTAETNTLQVIDPSQAEAENVLPAKAFEAYKKLGVYTKP
ncbi:MAG: hypothetical protein AAGI08_08035 [Bacteroidota bacterium]